MHQEVDGSIHLLPEGESRTPVGATGVQECRSHQYGKIQGKASGRRRQLGGENSHYEGRIPQVPPAAPGLTGM